MADTLDVGAEFNSEEHLAGLSDAEAASRIARYGFNELPSSKPRSIFRIAFEVVREPMLLLLLACGSTYLLLGDVQEAIILLIFVFVVIAITLYQERKTERALEALRDLSSPRALVVRGGERKRIAGREVVPGDVLVLSEGDRVPADGVLLSAVNLATDESLLTGESVPVRKQAASDDAEMARPGGDDLPFVFSGTLVVRGTGLALAKATGSQTELGKIGKSLREVEQEPTLLQRDTRHLVRVLGAGRTGTLQFARRCLWPDSRRLVAGFSRRAHACDGNPARRTARRFDCLPRARSLADVAKSCAHATHGGDRDARRSNSALR